MQAFLKNNRQAPRKVRLVARAVIGKNVSVALLELSMMPHKGASTLKKLISSAVANAKQFEPGLSEEDLVIKNITVDKGITYKRFRARAFGRAAPIHKECSHIRVTLEKIEGEKVEDVKIEKIEKTEKKESTITKDKTVKKEKKVEKVEKKKDEKKKEVIEKKEKKEAVKK